MLEHIALEVKETDLNSFYVGILGGQIIRQFLLKKDDAKDIFKVECEVPVCILRIGFLQLELFVKTSVSDKTFNHICFESEDAERIFKEASAKDYWVYRRNTNTFFIRDRNENMFEIKQNNGTDNER